MGHKLVLFLVGLIVLQDIAIIKKKAMTAMTDLIELCPKKIFWLKKTSHIISSYKSGLKFLFFRGNKKCLIKT